MINIARWKVILILAVCAAGFLYALPNVAGPQVRGWMQSSLPGWMPGKTINLGLDLRGGAHLLYEVDVDVVFKERAEGMLQELRTQLRKEKIGYSRIGTIPDGVRVRLRGVEDGEAVRKVLRGIDSGMDFKEEEGGLSIEAVLGEKEKKQIFDQTLSQSIEIVRRRIDELGTTEPVIQRQGEDRILVQAPGADAQALKSVIGTTAKLTFHLLPEGESTASRILPLAEEPSRKIAVERRAMMTGDMLTNAQPGFDQQGRAIVSFRLNNVGARRFCDITRDNVNKPFAIVLDNEVLSAPNINEPICGGAAQISGDFTVQETARLSLLLRAGALPAPMHVVEERTVGPSLGADSIQAGKTASILGLAFVLVFMGLAYGLFGMMANAALIINVVLIFALLSMLQATLTLPGIAGIVLTMGMAVDANVLIFERIREEFSAGRSVMAAIDAGYSRAMATIVDSNLTTLIAAGILFIFGTGPIKGFAVTLSIGIVTSMFAAVMVTRLMVIYWLRGRKPTDIPI